MTVRIATPHAPKRVTTTRTKVATGRGLRRPARGCRAGTQCGEVADTGQAHDLSPRLDVLTCGSLPLVLVEAIGARMLLGLHKPRSEAAPGRCLVHHFGSVDEPKDADASAWVAHGPYAVAFVPHALSERGGAQGVVAKPGDRAGR